MKKRLPLLTEVWTAQVGAPRGFANYVTPSRPNTDRQVCVFRMLKTPACTVPKSRVVSLLPTFAGRDLTL
jgi:hypothetical protein